jgi:hypothetical protein
MEIVCGFVCLSGEKQEEEIEAFAWNVCIQDKEGSEEQDFVS